MRPLLAAALGLLVIAPLALLIWLGLRLAQDEGTRTQARFDAEVSLRLEALSERLSGVVRERERLYQAAAAEAPRTPDELRSWLRTQRAFSQVMVLAPDGRLVFPPPEGEQSEAERAFLTRTRALWAGGALATEAGLLQGKATGSPDAGAPPPTKLGPDSGWLATFFDQGLSLFFWRRAPDGAVVAVELDRVTLISSLIAALPSEAPPMERVRLLDGTGATIYQWGSYAGKGHPALERPLAPPLHGFRLAWWGERPTLGASAHFGLMLGLAAVGLVLLAVAVWFYRENARALREAAARVTFVNQVSHELKTPLTNIRMYAELLAEVLEVEEDERTGRYVGVIVAESQRLSRLIQNILTFARQHRQTLTLRPGLGVVDEVVEAVAAQFGPALDNAGITLTLDLAAPARVQLDADAVGQILGNLLGNAEKYARGASVTVRTRQGEGVTYLTVTDGGPGIPPEHRERIFEPFFRLGGQLTEGVTGTGIGLGLARELARLHGGDLTLQPSEVGAAFEARLATPKEKPCAC